MDELSDVGEVADVMLLKMNFLIVNEEILGINQVVLNMIGGKLYMRLLVGFLRGKQGKAILFYREKEPGMGTSAKWFAHPNRNV